MTDITSVHDSVPENEDVDQAISDGDQVSITHANIGCDANIVSTDTTPDVVTCLETFGYKMVSPETMAGYIGFTPRQLEMLNLFWDPAFKKEWIYLSPDFIVNDLGYAKVGDFYTKLKSEYKDELEYKKVNRNHALIKKFYVESSRCRVMPGNRADFYIMSSKAIRNLLMSAMTTKGREIRNYYSAIEDLGIFMKDYIIALQVHCAAIEKANVELIINRQNKMIEDRTQDAVREQLRADVEKKRADDTTSDLERAKLVNEARARQIDKTKIDFKSQFRRRDQTIYVLTSDTYMNKDMYKIGKTKNQASGRAGALNTALIAADSLYVVSEYECSDAGAIETAVHKTLHPYRDSPSREFFQLPWSEIDREIVATISSQDAQSDRACVIVDSVIGAPLPGGSDARVHMGEARQRNATAMVPVVMTNEVAAQLAMGMWLASRPNGRVEYTWLKYQTYLKEFLNGRTDILKQPYRVHTWKYLSAAALAAAAKASAGIDARDLSLCGLELESTPST